MKKSELLDKCNEYGIVLDKEKKYTNWDLTLLLSNYFARKLYNNKKDWAFNYIREKESPMLAQRLNYLKPEEQERLFTSNEYFFDEKEDGIRMIIFYDPEVGFSFYSRNRSINTFLPIDYTNQISLTAYRPAAKDWKNIFKNKFIIDTEVIATNPKVSTIVNNSTGVVVETQLQAVQAILSMEQERSLQIQQKSCQLVFKCFDCMFFKKDVSEQNQRVRRVIAEKIVQAMTIEGFPISMTPMNFSNKKEFFDTIIANNGEGVIAKKWSDKYYWTNSRGRDRWVKIKRSVYLETDGIDAFLTNAMVGLQDNNDNIMNSFEFSVYLKDINGELKRHVIAYISGLSLELKKKMTVKTDNGIALNPAYLNKVAVITGQAISSREQRLRHAKFLNWRPDRSFDTCIIEESFLKSQII